MATKIIIETDTDQVIEKSADAEDLEVSLGGEFAHVEEVEVNKAKGVDKGFTFVWAPVLVPESTDHHGDIISALRS